MENHIKSCKYFVNIECQQGRRGAVQWAAVWQLPPDPAFQVEVRRGAGREWRNACGSDGDVWWGWALTLVRWPREGAAGRQGDNYGGDRALELLRPQGGATASRW